MTNHLNNVCIMQKYNDSEKVLELREEFQDSEEFIKKAGKIAGYSGAGALGLGLEELIRRNI